jgi:hypothetical protein
LAIDHNADWRLHLRIWRHRGGMKYSTFREDWGWFLGRVMSATGEKLPMAVVVQSALSVPPV